jgi:D-amino-acid dehydrogenase
VRVLEAHDGVGLETSFANAGMLTPSMPEPWNGPGVHRHLAASLFRTSHSMQIRWRMIPSLALWGMSFLRNSSATRFYAAVEDNYRLATYSRDKTLALTERLGLEYDLRDTGTLSLFQNAEHMEERRSICNRLHGLGMNSRELERDEIIELEPLLADVVHQYVGGIWLPDDASGDAHLFCRELAQAITAGGGEIDTGMRVSGLLVRNGKMVGVDTNRGRIDADRVVVATGARSPELLRIVGRSLPVKPAKGYSLTFNCKDPGNLPGVTIVDESSHAVVSRFGTRVRVVCAAEFAGFDKSISNLRVDHLFAALTSLLPRLAAGVDHEAAQAWAGLRPMSADGRPHIGAAGVDGLFVNSGHGALGWTMAMGSAHLLADLMLGTPTEIDHRPFLPFRH